MSLDSSAFDTEWVEPVCAVLWTKPRCVQCMATKKILEKENIPYTVCDIEEDEVVREFAADSGLTAAPIVLGVFGQGTHQWWSGFRADNLYRLGRQLRKQQLAMQEKPENGEHEMEYADDHM